MEDNRGAAAVPRWRPAGEELDRALRDFERRAYCSRRRFCLVGALVTALALFLLVAWTHALELGPVPKVEPVDQMEWMRTFDMHAYSEADAQERENMLEEWESQREAWYRDKRAENERLYQSRMERYRENKLRLDRENRPVYVYAQLFHLPLWLCGFLLLRRFYRIHEAEPRYVCSGVCVGKECYRNGWHSYSLLWLRMEDGAVLERTRIPYWVYKNCVLDEEVLLVRRSENGPDQEQYYSRRMLCPGSGEQGQGAATAGCADERQDGAVSGDDAHRADD